MGIGDEITEFNGVAMKIKDVPDQFIRAMLGFGHTKSRSLPFVVIPGEWEFTPDVCEVAALSGATLWIHEETYLVCAGCGLDCT